MHSDEIIILLMIYSIYDLSNLNIVFIHIYYNVLLVKGIIIMYKYIINKLRVFIL